MMEINEGNYYSPKANEAYFSASQVKAFRRCEAQAMAKITGVYERPMSTALSNTSRWIRGMPSPSSAITISR